MGAERLNSVADVNQAPCGRAFPGPAFASSNDVPTSGACTAPTLLQLSHDFTSRKWQGLGRPCHMGLVATEANGVLLRLRIYNISVMRNLFSS